MATHLENGEGLKRSVSAEIAEKEISVLPL